MKIGLSYSRCLRDIVDGKVDIKDILVIIARTDFDPRNDEEWQSIWIGYGGGTEDAYTTGFFSQSNPEWAGYTDEAKFREVSIELWNQGKLHQPRKFDAHPRRLQYVWLDTFAPEEEIAKNPSAQKAWDNYKLIAGLS